jgi:peptide chain release factor 2
MGGSFLYNVVYSVAGPDSNLGEEEKGLSWWKIIVNISKIWKNASVISGSIFDVDGKRSELAAIEEQIADPAFWDNSQESHQVLRRRRQLENSLRLAEDCQTSLDDVAALLELSGEGEDVATELEEELSSVEKIISDTEFATLLSGEHDFSNAIVSIHPGAGGTESQDWAEMLHRMYLRWVEQKGFKSQTTDYQPGEEAGLKSVTFMVSGEYAYGYLSTEIGVHRLVRISPFDAGARRHTSFASVFVSPEVDDTVDIEIEEKDLRVDTYRSSGAGGQHVNVTDSAVRVTHLPTGIVVQCQNERSQHRNKDVCMKIMRSKLFELEMEKRQAELDKIEGAKAEIGWGSQIRSYVLHPYQMVKDHRTQEETGRVDAILDGGIDDFILAALKVRAKKSVKEKAKKD